MNDTSYTFNFSLNWKEYNAKAIRNKISGCKNELMEPTDYEKYAASEFEKVVLKVYEMYQKTLKQLLKKYKDDKTHNYRITVL